MSSSVVLPLTIMVSLTLSVENDWKELSHEESVDSTVAVEAGTEDVSSLLFLTANATPTPMATTNKRQSPATRSCFLSTSLGPTFSVNRNDEPFSMFGS